MKSGQNVLSKNISTYKFPGYSSKSIRWTAQLTKIKAKWSEMYSSRTRNGTGIAFTRGMIHFDVNVGSWTCNLEIAFLLLLNSLFWLITFWLTTNICGARDSIRDIGFNLYNHKKGRNFSMAIYPFYDYQRFGVGH